MNAVEVNEEALTAWLCHVLAFAYTWRGCLTTVEATVAAGPVNRRALEKTMSIHEVVEEESLDITPKREAWN